MTFKDPGSVEVVLARLKQEFENGWFTPQQARIKINFLEMMTGKGLLDRGKPDRKLVCYRVIGVAK